YQPRGRDGPVGVPAYLSDLGPVQVTVQPHADPASPAHVGRPEEAAPLTGAELLLRSGQTRAPQVRKVVLVMAVGPQGHERLLVPDEPGRRAATEPLGQLRQRQADGP